MSNPNSFAGPVRIASIDGGASSELLDAGRVIGQVGAGMLIVDYTVGVDPAVGPWDLTRYVGAAGTAVSGVPQEFVDFVEPVAGDRAYHTYTGVACLDTTAILTAQTKDGGSSMPEFIVIYRSTDSGASFTEVKRWQTDIFTGKFGSTEVGYKGSGGGVWWVGAAFEASVVGLWRSADDGLTWTLVPNPTGLGTISLDNQPQIISSGRPDQRER